MHYALHANLNRGKPTETVPARRAARSCAESRFTLTTAASDRRDHVGYWPKCEVPTGSEYVCLSGWTGSDRRTVRMTRLAQSRSPQEKQLGSSRHSSAGKTVAKRRSGLFISRKYRFLDGVRRAIGMARFEGRGRVVFETQLDRLGRWLAGNLGDDAETEVDPRRDAACRDYIAILDDARLLMRGTDHGQKSGEGPVRSGASFLQQSGDTENKCTRAHRGHVLCCSSLPAHELYRIVITYRFDDARITAGDTGALITMMAGSTMSSNQ